MGRNVRLTVESSPKSKLEKLFEVFVLRSWWVWVFAALAYLLYANGMHKKQEAYREILNRIEELEREKKIALEDKEELLLQINSHADPASIQLILMKRLGVVPEGQTKVHFEKE